MQFQTTRSVIDQASYIGELSTIRDSGQTILGRELCDLILLPEATNEKRLNDKSTCSLPGIAENALSISSGVSTTSG